MVRNDSGNREDAIKLAIERWTKIHAFDLAPETWQQLFSDHLPGDVLEGVTRTGKTHDHRPDAVYASLLYWIRRFEAERQERITPSWPPPDTQQL
jgi:hypothetical protein